MKDPIQLINDYEQEISEIKKGEMPLLGKLSISVGDEYGGDIVETALIIESLNDLKATLPEDMILIINRAVADLDLLDTKTKAHNEVATKNNNVIIQKLADAQERLHVELDQFPEVNFKTKVRISTRQMSEQDIAFLDVVYKNLGFTHVERVSWRDFIFFEYEKRPNIRNEIINEYNKVTSENNHISQVSIGNFTHVETVSGHFSDLLNVFKSKIKQ